MRTFWWRRSSLLDAAGRRKVRANLGEIDYDLKRIMWDVARVSKETGAGEGTGDPRIEKDTRGH